MPMPRTHKPGAVRREEILSTAMALFISRGYSRVVMDEIGRACGLARPTLYEYYRSKEAILSGLIDEAVGKEVPAAPAGGTTRARLEALATLLLERVQSSSEVFLLIFREVPSLSGPIGEKLAERRRAEYGQILDVMRSGMAAGDFRPDIAAADAAFAFQALVGQRASDLLVLGQSYDPGAEAARIIDLLWRGVGQQ